MHSDHRAVRWVGGFFNPSNLEFLLGAAVFLERILGVPDSLEMVASNRSTVVLGDWPIVRGFKTHEIAPEAMPPVVHSREDGRARG